MKPLRIVVWSSVPVPAPYPELAHADPREAGDKLVTEGMQHPVALVFGRERTGLTNDELQNAITTWPFRPTRSTAPQPGHGGADPLL